MIIIIKIISIGEWINEDQILNHFQNLFQTEVEHMLRSEKKE